MTRGVRNFTRASIMTANLKTLAALGLAIAMLGGQRLTAETAPSDWRSTLKTELPRMGHRNFIVIADAAYPLQSAPGIKTIATGENQFEVVSAVLEEIAKSNHVSPIIYLDRELEQVTEEAAPGIGAYRKGLAKALADAKPTRVPHMEIIKKLDVFSELFNVLILKTKLTLPYTSVFIELDCSYWSAKKEAALRKSMENTE